MTHFEIFGLPEAVELDVAALEARHRALSMEFHPDRLSPTADSATRRQALERTTALNDALKVLKDPARRANYLLELNGVDLEKRQMPMEFLETILDRREKLEGARARKDLAAVTSMAGEIQGLREQALTRAFKALRALPAGLEAAAAEMATVKYYARFLDEVEAIEEESFS